MEAWKAGWFTEQGVLNGDAVTLSIKAEEVLHKETSKYQELTVFQRYVDSGGSILRKNI